MSFIKVTEDLLEKSTVVLRPRVHFISSSEGITGSATVASNLPRAFKSIIDPNVIGTNSYLVDNTNPGYDELDYVILNSIQDAIAAVEQAEALGISTSDISGFMDRYMEAVGDAPSSTKNKTINVFRFLTPFEYNKNFTVKSNIKNVLMPYHRTRYQDCQYSYTNYNTLNFFTGSGLPENSCLMYPNHTKTEPAEAFIYSPDGPFTLDFWINPRYTSEPEKEFHAGTIFHLSSSICLSLVSGSQKGGNNNVEGFRLLLQLSQSADKAPSTIGMNETLQYPNDLIFSSSDNSLLLNNWHHVTVRWGGKDLNEGLGEIKIDDNVDNFLVPSSSITTMSGSDVVVLGNYFDGQNLSLAKFFNSNAEALEGVTDWNDGAAGSQDPDPSTYDLSHPLNAEIHDIKLFGSYLFKRKLDQIRYNGVSTYDDLLFYVPPFFTPDTRSREVLVTPFQKILSNTNDPFNVAFSFGVGGIDINLDNFVKEFVKGEYPRLFNLTGSTIDTTIENITADQYVYASGSNLKRNFTILPNDNGLFKPNYFPVSSPVSGTQTNFLGHGDPSIVSLDNLIPTASLFPGLVFQSGSILDDIIGASPENPGVQPGAVLTIAQRLRDLSSNQVTTFDISNLYYSNRIHPGSFEVKDTSLTGSSGKIKLTFKDNQDGSLYRADALTKHATWNNAGNIFYDEGIVLIKTPHAPYFCKDKTDMSFRGEHSMHVLTFNAPCPSGMFNSSSNPQFKLLSASNDLNDTDRFVYITGINLHDDNLNVIMRANLAQPVLKRESDGVLFKIKKDF